MKWGSLGLGNGQFEFPRGIAIDNSGYIYVADGGRYSNSQIQKFNTDGTFISTWGDGAGLGGAWGILTDDGGNNIFVSDSVNCHISQFSGNGSYMTEWSSGGTNNGELESPRGMARNGLWDFYIADIGNNRIQKFDSNGSF